ncbi:Megf8, partial [Acrasis kona]
TTDEYHTDLLLAVASHLDGGSSTLIAVSVQNQTLKWTLELPFETTADPVLLYETLYMTHQNNVFSYNIFKNESNTYNNVTDQNIRGISTYGLNDLIFNCDDGALYRVNFFAGNSTIIWSLVESGELTTSITSLKDQVLTTALDENGNTQLLVYNTSSGDLLSSTKFEQYGGKIINTGSLSFSSDGLILLQALVKLENSDSYASQLLRIGQLNIEEVTPARIYTTDSHLNITITGTGFTTFSQVNCVFFKSSVHIISQAVNINNQSVECGLGHLPEAWFKKADTIDLYITVNITQGSFHQVYKSTKETVQVFPPIVIEDIFPFAIPEGAELPEIKVQGKQFKVMDRQAKKATCRLVYEKDQQIKSITEGLVEADDQVLCNSSSLLTDLPVGNYVLQVGIEDQSFFASRVLFSIYNVPFAKNLLPKIIPTAGNEQGFHEYSFELSGFDADVLSSRKLAKLCKFEHDDQYSAATCVPSGGKTSCFCKLPDFDQPRSGLYFSLNGQHFNKTEMFVDTYEQPILSSLHPSQGNLSGGTLVVIDGEDFFNTTSIKCNFGGDQLSVPATFISNFNVSCISPESEIPTTVLVYVSMNGIDYVSGINASFQYQMRHSCPGGCSNHGVCDQLKGVCDCYEMYTGTNCELRLGKTGHWTYVIISISVLSASFLVFSVFVCIFYSYKKNLYKRLVDERQKNDISSAL